MFLKDIVFKKHKDYFFNASDSFDSLKKELLINIGWYLKEYGFDVYENDKVLEVHYQKGKAFETLEKLKKYIPVENIKTYYGFFEISL